MLIDVRIMLKMLIDVKIMLENVEVCDSRDAPYCVSFPARLTDKL